MSLYDIRSPEEIEAMEEAQEQEAREAKMGYIGFCLGALITATLGLLGIVPA